MAVLTGGKGKAVIKEWPHKVEITMPNRRSIYPVMTGFAMVFGGVMALSIQLFVFKDQSTGGEIFFVFWYAVVGITILLGIRFLLFSLLGKETWTIEGEYFTKKLNVLFYKKEQSYFLTLMKGFRLSEEDDYGAPSGFFQQRQPDLYDLRKGTIKFDYGRDTIRIGNGLSEAEARHLLTSLKEKGLLTSDNFY